MRSPKGILFDLDCTLTDRSSSLASYARVFLNHFGERLRDVHESTILGCLADVDHNGYLPREKCWAYLLANLDWRESPSLSEFDELWHTRWPGCAVATAGVLRTLQRLSAMGLALGIVTNGPSDVQERKVEALGVGSLMRVVIVSGAFGFAKPLRAIFELACERLGVAPADVWFVGDNPVNDAIGARHAGLTDVWLRGYAPWPPGRLPPTSTIDRVEDLLPMLEDAS